MEDLVGCPEQTLHIVSPACAGMSEQESLIQLLACLPDAM